MNKTETILNEIAKVIDDKITKIKSSQEYIEERNYWEKWWLDNFNLEKEYKLAVELEAKRHDLENQLDDVNRELSAARKIIEKKVRDNFPHMWVGGFDVGAILSEVGKKLVEASELFAPQKEIVRLTGIRDKARIILAMASTPKQVGEAVNKLLENIGASTEDLLS